MNTIRKHRSQMSLKEMATVTAIVRAIEPRFRDYGHQAVRMDERQVNQDEVRETLKHGNVIEVSLTDRQDVRCLVRWDNSRESIVVAISLKTGFVCTAWKNSLNDTHRTLNMALYTKTLNLIPLLPVAAS